MIAARGQFSARKRRARMERVIAASRAELEAVIARAETAAADSGSSPRDSRLIARAKESLAELRVVAERGADLEIVAERAATFARIRASLLPFCELAPEAQSRLATLRQWQVPFAALTNAQILSHQVARAADDDEPVRAAFGELSVIFDYWRSYLALYLEQRKIAAAALLVTLLVSVGLAILAVTRAHASIGFMLAAMGGTAASIAIKLPSPSLHGDTASFGIRILTRIAGGLVAAVVGFGVLGSNLLDIRLGDHRVADSLHCAQTAATLGRTGDGHSCGETELLFILSLGLLIGFSERALVSLDQATFTRRARALLVSGDGGRLSIDAPRVELVTRAPTRLESGTVELKSVPARPDLAGPGGSFRDPSSRGSK
jgi:hypothetical protein